MGIKYRVGSEIKSLSELMRQNVVFLYGTHIVNKAFFQNWQIRYCKIQIDRGVIKKAVLIKKERKN